MIYDAFFRVDAILIRQKYAFAFCAIQEIQRFQLKLMFKIVINFAMSSSKNCVALLQLRSS